MKICEYQNSNLRYEIFFDIKAMNEERQCFRVDYFDEYGMNVARGGHYFDIINAINSGRHFIGLKEYVLAP